MTQRCNCVRKKDRGRDIVRGLEGRERERERERERASEVGEKGREKKDKREEPVS